MRVRVIDSDELITRSLMTRLYPEREDILALTHRVSRPRSTGSVGDSVREGSSHPTAPGGTSKLTERVRSAD